MSLTKNEMIFKAIENNRHLWFTFKKDGTYRTVEPYAFFRDDRGNLKVWCYQPSSMDTKQKSGPRVFFVEDMTYMELGAYFSPRLMKDPPHARDVIAQY